MLHSDTTLSDEKYGPVRVDLRCSFPGAEVILVDGHLRLAGRGIEELHVDVPPGVYTARVRIGEASRDERIVVRPNDPFMRELAPPAVASAIPLTGSAKTHEYHQAAASRADAPELPLHADGNASVFVLLREWTIAGVGQRSVGPMAAELILRSADGADIHSFEIESSDPSGDRVTAQGVRLRAGFYRLLSRVGDAIVELPLYTIAGWQTHVYLLSQATAEGLAPDFGRASILWAKPGGGFDPGREDLRVLESVRTAAESGRHHVSDKGLKEALYQKFDNPMLGLVSAHAMLQRRVIEPAVLLEVTTNLEGILGTIPDVIALRLAVNPQADVPPIEFPPVLRWSWALLLQRSIDRPDLVRRHSLAERVGSHVTGRGIWMSWIADPHTEHIISETQLVARDAVVSAASQTWRQVNQRLHEWTPARKKKAASGSSLDVSQTASVIQSGLEGIVRMFGVPRRLIDEAVGTAVSVARGSADLPKGETVVREEKRRQFNERFVQRLLARRPQDRPGLEERLQHEEVRLQHEGVADLPGGAAELLRNTRDIALETIVRRERPVLFVRNGQFDTTEVTTLGPEAVDLVERMKQHGNRLLPLLPLIGRIDVANFPGSDFVGTGWFVDTDIVVTNRHVATLIARWDGRKFVFTRGVGSQLVESSFCNAHEFDDLDPDATRVFKVTEVLYIEPDSGPHDIAFLKVERRTDGNGPAFIPVASSDAVDELPVCVVGYPARAPKRVIPDQELMKQLYRDRYDVKRAAPGFTSGIDRGATTHDCTTLGGNSGSVVLDLASGLAVGLHYAGLYEEDNFAVRASVLTDYIRRKRWNTPPSIETRPPALSPMRGAPQQPAPTAPLPSTTVPVAAQPASSGSSAGAGVGSVNITVPLTITVSLGSPQLFNPGVAGVSAIPGVSVVPGAATGSPGTPPIGTVPLSVEVVEEALLDFWDHRPQGVLAARVGYFDKGDAIGDQPCIAASVLPLEWARFEAGGPHIYRGVPVRYLPADVDEQVHSLPSVESVDSISYDDDARTGERFSFAQVNEAMDVTLHVGPEYSWEVLQNFLVNAQGRLVSAMYEFHAPHVQQALEGKLNAGGSLTLVLDNATFGKVRHEDESFDRVSVFEDWADRFTFSRVVAPEGRAGLISDSYHIKVTVRDDDAFWLSSGNWKAGSSQPIITQEQRDNASNEDLPGNREWHVVIKNKKLASRLRNHILQDFSRAVDLGGGPVSRSLMDETFVDIPIEEAVVLERRPPSRILEPKKITNRKVKVRPLLTPDKEGAIYSEAVLGLIQSARTSLLFQIPYIGMAPNPREDRGFIDELIRALTLKLKTLDDARVLLRSGGSKFSAPAHAAWYFKSKGVDIENRLRVIEDHHTKGMIVDDRLTLLGSHNWSKPGVSLNRDASLLFDDEEIAEYYTEAFEIDWARANPVRPKRFIKPEGLVLEAVGDAPPPGFQRVRLSDLLKDD